jgi:hypothetical protein
MIRNAHCTLGTVLVAVAGTSLMTGCGLVSQQLHVSDDSRVLASARVVKRLASGPGGPGVELEVSRAEARGPQSIAATSSVSVGTQTINGPATLQHRAQVDNGHLVYNHLLFAGRPVELEWFVGGAWGRTRWDSTSSNPSDPALSSRSSWYGPTGGALGRLNLAPMLSFEARYAGAIALSGAVDTSSRTLVEAALAFRPPGGVVLRGGFAELRSVMRPEVGTSELSVRARGPFLNLGLEF